MGNYVSFYESSVEYTNNNINNNTNNKTINVKNIEYENSNIEKNSNQNEKEVYNYCSDYDYDYEEISIIENILINYNNGNLTRENILILINDYIEMSINSKTQNRNFVIIKKFAKQFEDGIYDKTQLNL